MRYLLYSHDGFGLGHTRRHLAVARALTELDREASVLLVSGSEEAHRFGMPPRVEILKLPALRKIAKGEYVARRLNIRSYEVLDLRSQLLTAAVNTYAPSVVLVDKHPFGVCGEFHSALTQARSLGARTVLGLRDILDEPAAVIEEWAEHREQLPSLFDSILVYGMQAVFDPIREYKFDDELAARTTFCGYVLNEEPVGPKRELLPDDESRPFVVATAGGGEDGFALLDAFLRASLSAPWRAFVVAGPMIADARYSDLESLATEANATLNRFVPNVHHLFHFADALVCMGGYNTLVEAAATGIPTLCVPRMTPRREQTLRANAFEKLGLLRVLSPEELTSEVLRKRIANALSKRREKISANGRGMLEFDGAMQAARHLRDLAKVRANGALRESFVA